MTKEQLINKLNLELDNWLETNNHRYNCSSRNEGQFCCLDKEKEESGRDFIIKFLQNNFNQPSEPFCAWAKSFD